MTFTYLTCFLSLCILFFLFSCRNQHSDGKTEKLSHGFTRDRDTIRYYSETLEVDANTFQVIDDAFCKDAYQVFYFRSYRESSDYFLTKKHSVQKLDGADPASFESLGYDYAKDKSKAWYKTRTFEVEDLQSLNVLDRHFAKDNIRVYLDRVPVSGSDGSTFRLIEQEPQYVKDASHYYYIISYSDGGSEIQPIACQYASFQVLDYQYAKDAQNAFYLGNKMKGADPARFELLGHRYSRDGQHVFFGADQVAGADPQTFVPFRENENSSGTTVYARDKNGIYINEKRFAGVDLATFKILDEKYSIDRNGVYFNTTQVRNADPNSFKVYPQYFGNADAEDKNHKYGDGKVVEE